MIFFVGLIRFLKNRNNVLAALISLEIIVLGIRRLLLFLGGSAEVNTFLIRFLTFAVCERALGFSVVGARLRGRQSGRFTTALICL